MYRRRFGSPADTRDVLRDYHKEYVERFKKEYEWIKNYDVTKLFTFTEEFDGTRSLTTESS